MSADERTFSFSLLSNDRRGRAQQECNLVVRLGFGAVQSGFGGAEPPRLPEMLPVRDARGPVEEGAFQTASRPLVSRWPHFHEGLLLLLFSRPGTSFFLFF